MMFRVRGRQGQASSRFRCSKFMPFTHTELPPQEVSLVHPTRDERDQVPSLGVLQWGRGEAQTSWPVWVTCPG